MPLRASLHPGSPNSPSCSALAWYSCWPGLSPWGESWKRPSHGSADTLPLRHSANNMNLWRGMQNSYMYTVHVSINMSLLLVGYTIQCYIDIQGFLGVHTILHYRCLTLAVIRIQCYVRKIVEIKHKNYATRLHLCKRQKHIDSLSLSDSIFFSPRGVELLSQPVRSDSVSPGGNTVHPVFCVKHKVFVY